MCKILCIWRDTESVNNKLIDFRKVHGRQNVYFLRHGESEGNNALIIQGRKDYPLSEVGEKQSRIAGLWFKDRDIDVILHSPLSRAKQTADIVAEQLGIQEVLCHKDLNELDTGIFTGMTRKQVQETYPAEWKAFREHSWDSVPQAERICDTRKMVERYWEYLISLLSDGKRNILSVTHSGTLQWLIKVTIGHEKWMPLFPMSNCGIFHFSINNNIKGETPAYFYAWEHINLHP